MNIFIYALINPKNSQVFYVGCTNNIELRFKTHLRNKKSSTITGLIKDGLLPIVQVLEECSLEFARINEDKWVLHFLSRKAVLENRTLISYYPIKNNKNKNKGELILDKSLTTINRICLKFKN